MRQGRRVLTAGAAIVIAAAIFAQGHEAGSSAVDEHSNVHAGQGDERSGLGKSAHQQSTSEIDNSAVNLSEVYATMDRAEEAVRKVVLGSKEPLTRRSLVADRPATRTDIIAEFHRIYVLAKPKFKYTPRKVEYDASLLTIPDSDASRTQLDSLLRFGFVGKVAPLATNPTQSMSIFEYGDALGFFLARIGDLTHTPSAKWSPYMFGHKDF